MQNIMKFSEAGQRYSDIEGINQFSKHDALHCDDATKLKIVRRIVHKNNCWKKIVNKYTCH